jgi:hypothetical protein
VVDIATVKWLGSKRRYAVCISGLLTLVLNSEVRAEAPLASLIGGTVHLHPSGAIITIPDAWLRRDSQFHDTLHVSRAELQEVEKTGTGAWGAEYAQVVNSALPFQMCVLHAGNMYSDLHMRTYLGRWSFDQLQQLTRDKGLAAAKKISKEPEIKNAEIKEDTVGEWRRSTISFPVWHYDYGGTANVAFYSRRLEGETVVLVFMYSTGSPVEGMIQGIVSSFKRE